MKKKYNVLLGMFLCAGILIPLNYFNILGFDAGTETISYDDCPECPENETETIYQNNTIYEETPLQRNLSISVKDGAGMTWKSTPTLPIQDVGNLNRDNFPSTGSHPQKGSFEEELVSSFNITNSCYLENVTLNGSYLFDTRINIYNSTWNASNLRIEPHEKTQLDQYLSDTGNWNPNYNAGLHTISDEHYFLNNSNTYQNTWFLGIESDGGWSWAYDDDSETGDEFISYRWDVDTYNWWDDTNQDVDYAFELEFNGTYTEEITNATYSYNNSAAITIMKTEDFLDQTTYFGHYNRVYNWMLNETVESTVFNCPVGTDGGQNHSNIEYENYWSKTVQINDITESVTITLPNDCDDFIIVGRDNFYDDGNYYEVKSSLPTFSFSEQSEKVGSDGLKTDTFEIDQEFVHFNPFQNRNDEGFNPLGNDNSTFNSDVLPIMTDVQSSISDGVANQTLAEQMLPLLNSLERLYRCMSFTFDMENYLEIGDITFDQGTAI